MNTRTSPSIGTQTKSTALEKQHLIAASPATLVSVLATNTGAADAWLQIHDKATAAANADVPVLPIFIAAGGTVALDTPVKCLVGIQVALSSTPGSYTALGSDVAWFVTRHL